MKEQTILLILLIAALAGYFVAVFLKGQEANTV